MSLVGTGRIEGLRVTPQKDRAALRAIVPTLDGDMRSVFTAEAWGALTRYTKRFFQDAGFRSDELERAATITTRAVPIGDDPENRNTATVLRVFLARLQPNNAVGGSLISDNELTFNPNALLNFPVAQQLLSDAGLRGRLLLDLLAVCDRYAVENPKRLAILKPEEMALQPCPGGLASALNVGEVKWVGDGSERPCVHDQFQDVEFVVPGTVFGARPDPNRDTALPDLAEPFPQPRALVVTDQTTLKDAIRTIRDYNETVRTEGRKAALRGISPQTGLTASRQSEQIASEIDRVSTELRTILDDMIGTLSQDTSKVRTTTEVFGGFTRIVERDALPVFDTLKDQLQQLKQLALKAKAEETVPMDRVLAIQRDATRTLTPLLNDTSRWNCGRGRSAFPCNIFREVQTTIDNAVRLMTKLQRLQQRKQDIKATEETVIPEQVARTLEDIQESQQTIEQRQARLGEARQLLNELTMTESAKARDGTSQLAEDLTKTLSQIQKQLESQGKVEKSTAEQAQSKADKLAENASDSDTAEKAKQAIDEATGTDGGEAAEATQDLKLGKIGQFVKDRPVVSAGAGLLALRLLMGR